MIRSNLDDGSIFVNTRIESLVLMAAEEDGTPMVTNLPNIFVTQHIRKGNFDCFRTTYQNSQEIQIY